MLTKVNCIYFAGINTCTHPEKKWFFKKFNGSCNDTGGYSPCELREGYKKPDILPPAPQPPSKRIKIKNISVPKEKYGNKVYKYIKCEHCGKFNKI